MSNIPKLDLYESFWEAAELASMPELTDAEQIATLRWQREHEQKLILEIVKDFPGDTIVEKVAAMAESLKFHKRSIKDLKDELDSVYLDIEAMGEID